MKFYDGKDYFRILVDCTGGHVLNDTRNYVMLAVVWSAIAVTLEQQVAEKATGEQVDLPSLSGVVFVAGFMLAMQASSAYKRFKAGMDAALELEEQSFELMRHACMIFDTADLAWLRVECRRTLLVVILSLIVDVKTSASHGGAEYKALGMECLRRAADANMLTVQEKQLLFKKKMAPRIFFRVAAREFQSKMIRLLYDEQSEAWRVRWQKEKTNQPMVNFVKTMDGHWKGILGTGSQMILLTEQNFPLCYVQISRLLWVIIVLLFPFDLAPDMGYFTCVIMCVFVVSYFSMELISTDLENPFGQHNHSIDLNDLFSRVERISAAMLASCGQNLIGSSLDTDEEAIRNEERRNAEEAMAIVEAEKAKEFLTLRVFAARGLTRSTVDTQGADTDLNSHIQAYVVVSSICGSEANKLGWIHTDEDGASSVGVTSKVLKGTPPASAEIPSGPRTKTVKPVVSLGTTLDGKKVAKSTSKNTDQPLPHMWGPGTRWPGLEGQYLLENCPIIPANWRDDPTVDPHVRLVVVDEHASGVSVKLGEVLVPLEILGTKEKVDRGVVVSSPVCEWYPLQPLGLVQNSPKKGKKAKTKLGELRVDACLSVGKQPPLLFEGGKRSSAVRYDVTLMVDPLKEGKTTAQIRNASVSKHFRRKKNGAVVVDNFQGDDDHDIITDGDRLQA